MSTETKTSKTLYFAELPNGKIVKSFNEKRSHANWLKEDHGIGAKAFELIVCGSAKNDKFFVHKGAKLSRVYPYQRIGEIITILCETEDDLHVKQIYNGGDEQKIRVY